MEWISCENRLPDTHKMVVVFGEEISVSMGHLLGEQDLKILKSIWEDFDFDNGTWFDGDWFHPCRCTHWMPLPEPPTQQKP